MEPLNTEGLVPSKNVSTPVAPVTQLDTSGLVPIGPTEEMSAAYAAAHPELSFADRFSEIASGTWNTSKRRIIPTAGGLATAGAALALAPATSGMSLVPLALTGLGVGAAGVAGSMAGEELQNKFDPLTPEEAYRLSEFKRKYPALAGAAELAPLIASSTLTPGQNIRGLSQLAKGALPGQVMTPLARQTAVNVGTNLGVGLGAQAMGPGGLTPTGVAETGALSLLLGAPNTLGKIPFNTGYATASRTANLVKKAKNKLFPKPPGYTEVVNEVPPGAQPVTDIPMPANANPKVWTGLTPEGKAAYAADLAAGGQPFDVAPAVAPTPSSTPTRVPRSATPVAPVAPVVPIVQAPEVVPVAPITPVAPAERIPATETLPVPVEQVPVAPVPATKPVPKPVPAPRKLGIASYEARLADRKKLIENAKSEDEIMKVLEEEYNDKQRERDGSWELTDFAKTFVDNFRKAAQPATPVAAETPPAPVEPVAVPAPIPAPAPKPVAPVAPVAPVVTAAPVSVPPAATPAPVPTQAPKPVVATPAPQPAAPQPAQAAGATPTLPKELAGAKPRYGYGAKQFQPIFESDLDRSAYIVSQKNKNARHDDYVAWATEKFGMTEADLAEHGQRVRDAIKQQAKVAEGGTTKEPEKINIPALPRAETKPVVAEPQTPAVLEAQTKPAKTSLDILPDESGLEKFYREKAKDHEIAAQKAINDGDPFISFIGMKASEWELKEAKNYREKADAVRGGDADFSGRGKSEQSMPVEVAPPEQPKASVQEQVPAIAEKPVVEKPSNAVPENYDRTITAVERLAGRKLSEQVKNEISILAEEGLQPDFLKDANINNLRDHLVDLSERIDGAIDASKTGVLSMNSKDANLIKKGQRDAKRAVEAAIAKIDSEASQVPTATQPATELAPPTSAKPSVEIPEMPTSDWARGQVEAGNPLYADGRKVTRVDKDGKIYVDNGKGGESLAAMTANGVDAFSTTPKPESIGGRSLPPGVAAAQIGELAGAMDIVQGGLTAALVSDKTIPSLNPIAANMHLVADGRGLGVVYAGTGQRFVPSKAMKEVSEMFLIRDGNVAEGAKETLYGERDAERRRLTGKLVSVFDPVAAKMEGMTKAQLAKLDLELTKMITGEMPIDPNTPEGKVALGLKQFADEAHDYGKSAGLEIGYAKDYGMPHSINAAAVESNQAGFLADATRAYAVNNPERIAVLTNRLASAKGKEAQDIQAEIDLLKNAKPKEQAQAYLDNILLGAEGADRKMGLLLDGGGAQSNTADFAKERIFGPKARSILRDYYNNNPLQAWHDYVNRSTTMAEFARRFGAKGEKWLKYVEQMRAEGAPETQIELFKNQVKDALGTLNIRPSSGHALANSMLAGSNMAKLKTTGLANFLESLSPATRGQILSGSLGPIRMARNVIVLMGEMTPGQAAAFKEAMGREASKPNADISLARAVGLIDAAGVHDIMTNSAHSVDQATDYEGSGLAKGAARFIRKGTEGLSRAYGIEITETAKRADAARMASNRLDGFIDDLLNDNFFARVYKAANPKTQSNPLSTMGEARMRLRRAGLSDAEMVAFAKEWQNQNSAGTFDTWISSNDPLAAKARKAIRLEASQATVDANRAFGTGGQPGGLMSQDHFLGKTLMTFMRYSSAAKQQVFNPMGRDVKTGISGQAKDIPLSSYSRFRMASQALGLPAMAAGTAAFLYFRDLMNGYDDKTTLQRFIEAFSYTGAFGGKSEFVNKNARGESPPVFSELSKIAQDINRAEKGQGRKVLAKSAVKFVAQPATQIGISAVASTPVAMVLARIAGSKAVGQAATDAIVEDASQKPKDTRGSGKR